MVTRTFIGSVLTFVSHPLLALAALCNTEHCVFKKYTRYKILEYLNIVQEELINNCGVNKIIEKEKVMKRDKTELH